MGSDAAHNAGQTPVKKSIITRRLEARRQARRVRMDIRREFVRVAENFLEPLTGAITAERKIDIRLAHGKPHGIDFYFNHLGAKFELTVPRRGPAGRHGARRRIAYVYAYVDRRRQVSGFSVRAVGWRAAIGLKDRRLFYIHTHNKPERPYETFALRFSQAVERGDIKL